MRYLDHNPEVVALCGMGPSLIDIFNEKLTQEYSPNYADEIWAINMTANVLKHDVVFWMDDFEQQQHFKPGLFEELRRSGRPVITSVARPDIVPLSYDFPLNEVCQLSMPFFGKPYLTNGVAMGIGYAMYKKVKVLKVYGCDFTYPNRNFAEEGRACTEAWITLASVKGMEIQLAPSTSLFDHVADKGIYGYREQPEVTGPNGVKFKYIKKDEAVGQYVATDSGGDDAVSRYLPRAPGRAAEVSGPAPDQRDAASQAPAVAAEGPGAGVRDRGGPGRPEAGHPARPNGSGETGRLPATRI